ncbi:MAG TPA: hypothetical protein DHU96_01830 [Actinobacteria bacterium]|nr:hypothetical protein [Actinomycetota bacterium]
MVLLALDRAGRIVMINKKGHHLLGYRESDLLGKDWFDNCMPEPHRAAARQIFTRIMAGDLIEVTENPVLTSTGEERLVAWHNSVIHDRIGNILGTLSSGEDITEQRRAEEELARLLAEQQLILDNATVGISFVKNRVYQRCNPRFEEMFGYAPGEMVGRSTAIVFPSMREYEQACETRYEVLARGERSTGERQLKRRDGTLIWCKIVGRAIDPARPHEGTIWIYDDISAEHAARESLEASRAALERAVAERTAELESANRRLEQEIGERKQAEERARHLAVGEDEVVAPGRRRLGHREQPGQPADQVSRRATDDGQRIGIPLLRHKHACPAIAVGQGHVVKLLAGPDLQVLGQLGLGHHQPRGRADHVEQAIDLPHRVPGVLGDAAETQQCRDVTAVGAQPGAVHTASPARAGIGPRQRLAQTPPPAQHRERERENIVTERGWLRVLQICLVGHQRGGVVPGPAGELGCQVGGRLHQAGQIAAQAQPEGYPQRLPPGTARVQPAGHVAHPADEVPLP